MAARLAKAAIRDGRGDILYALLPFQCLKVHSEDNSDWESRDFDKFICREPRGECG